jgi:non-specific serine/threonine protein kinase
VAGRFPHDGITDFVGRRDELARLATLLNASRLVTVVGPGGVGKTRLARVAAAEAMDNYPDGVWIVEQSGLRDAALLPNTVASVLGLPEQDARSALDAVLEYLRDKRLLLILDTCEHVLDACAELAQAVLADAPGVTCLATSRQPLDTAGEQNFAIQPLLVPEPDAVELGHDDAVELFALRAAAAVPGFTVNPDNSATVVRLCRRLDGIPLAIELAAVQLRALDLEELTQRLDRRFKVLTGGHPGALERHQTLRTAIEWSHDLCSPAERRLWARLSVFAGTFSLVAAEEVCAEVEIEQPEVVDALIGLIDKSVVLQVGTRYRMLDTLREFGAERLAASGEEAACRARHIDRYLRMARYFGEHFTDDDQMERYRDLHQTHANVRAALEYALDDLVGSPMPAVPSGASSASGASGASGAGGPELDEADGSPTSADGANGAVARWRSGVDMACSLYGYWQISGLLNEGGYWLSKALERFPEDGHERARALVTRGFLRSFQGEIEGALDDLETGIAVALAIGDVPVTARGYQHLHLAQTFGGLHDEAFATWKEARPRVRACGDRPGELMLLAQHGHLCQLAGQLLESVATCEEGLDILGPNAGEQWLQSYLLVVEGFALFQVPGREADCETVVRKALVGKQKLGDVIGMGYGLDVLGWVSAKTGKPERTAWTLGAADPLWERGGLRFSGTEIMMDFHREAARAASAALGQERYDAVHAAGVEYMKGQLKNLALGGSVELSIP